MAADARLFEAVALQTVEAALTGESTPVTKDVAPIPIEAGLGDRTNMVTHHERTGGCERRTPRVTEALLRPVQSVIRS